MNVNKAGIPTKLGLKAGELVQVRSKEDILATLDPAGCIEGLPFMPEMLAFCGRQLRVHKRAHKTCDTIHSTGSRRIENAVHLEIARCDGQAHGGCQARCQIFWKEAWLKRVETNPKAPGANSLVSGGCLETRGTVADSCSERELCARTKRPVASPEDEIAYVCQATQLLVASTPLSSWNLHQYWEDYASGNVGLGQMLGSFFYASYNKAMERGGRFGLPKFLLALYNKVQEFRRRPQHPRTRGRIPRGGRTPAVTLNLQPGEWVRVKSFDEILDTIDRDYRNRGMTWDAEMVPYCGGVYRVHSRVKQIIDEETGKLIQFKSEAVILEGATCQSRYSDCRYFCPRATYAYWREIWLERVQPAPASSSVAAGDSGQSCPQP